MPKTKISEFSATPANNTDIDSINIAEGCAPSGINDAIRELMAQLKDFQTGAVGDSFNGPIGTSTAAAGAFTTLSASSTTTLSGLTASTALALDASKNVVSVTNTGTGSNVLATSPTLVTPILGTPTSATLTNATGLPIATGVSGLGTGVATFLATPSSANLRSALTDETGTGSAVFATSPTLVTPALGTPSSAVLTNATGLPNAGLVNSSITIGGTAIALGASSNALANDITVNGVNVGKGGGSGLYNTLAGSGAMSSLTTGAQNSAFGTSAVTSTNSGSNNVGFGRATLLLNTSGSANTAIGTDALFNNLTASNNTAVGYQAGYSNQTGTSNVLLGKGSGYTNISGNNNVYIGAGKVGFQDPAGFVATGSNNTFVGGAAGATVLTGSANTIIGQYNGNQGGLNITTASNYIVLSDGDGNPLISTNSTRSVALNGAVPQTGTGITFPATQSASSDAKTLDDYEEGTWTPTLSFGGGSAGIVYSVNSGTYTKIGNLVTGRFIIGLSSKGSSGGNAVIGGLPFTLGSALGVAVTELASNFTLSPPTNGWPQDVTTNLNLWAMGATGIVYTTDASFANNTRLDMWFQYFIV
jgi:hypothetical protein